MRRPALLLGLVLALGACTAEPTPTPKPACPTAAPTAVEAQSILQDAAVATATVSGGATGSFTVELFGVASPDKVIAVWGCGPVGQFAIASARMLGAQRVIAIDRFPYRLALAKDRAGATDVINYEEGSVVEALKELTGGRGPDACIDAVGIEAHGHGAQYLYDRGKQMAKLELDRPIAVREAILACRSGGIVSIVGVYAGFVDKFPLGALMNRSLTIRTGQCHVQRYLRPLLERIERGDIDPSFVVSHHMGLDDAPRGYDMFHHKRDEAMKIVLRA
jgi:threonine dehydrogenase-like Zn-dependent dehydrogenase